MAVPVLRFHEADERDEAVQRLDGLIARLAQAMPRRSLCSRDAEVQQAKPELVDLIPAHFAGVKRWFLPIAPSMPTDGKGRFGAYTSCLAPGATVPERRLEASHGALKVVVSGSIHSSGHELTAGDWLWIAPGDSYGFSAGGHGAVVFTVLPCIQIVEHGHADLSALITQDGFVTSRDPGISDGSHVSSFFSEIAEQADGVVHSFFPFAPAMPVTDVKDGRFFAWLARLAPGTDIPAHTHDLEKLADYKVVISGSIIAHGGELTAGDWLWAPAGGSYAFTAGEQGALLLAGWPWN